jgi:hypothetical protein
MTISWAITSLAVSQDPNPDTVKRVFYEASASPNISVSGECDLGPVGESFIPYSSLTESDVLAWVWSLVNKQATEDYLVRLQTETIAETLPWQAGI